MGRFFSRSEDKSPKACTEHAEFAYESFWEQAFLRIN